MNPGLMLGRALNRFLCWLLRKNLFDSAFGWHYYRHPQGRAKALRTLVERFPAFSRAEIERAYSLAGKLHDAVIHTELKDRDKADFDRVVERLKQQVPGLSERAYRTAADKVFFINR